MRLALHWLTAAMGALVLCAATLCVRLCSCAAAWLALTHEMNPLARSDDRRARQVWTEDNMLLIREMVLF